MITRAVVAISLLVSILQGALFAVQTPHAIGALGIGLAIVTLLVASRQFFAKADRGIWALVLLCCLQLGIFAAYLAVSPFSWQFRLLIVAIVLVYSATALAVVLVSTKSIVPANAFLLAFAVALAGFFAEAVLEIKAPVRDSKQAGPVPEWSGRTEPHPILGQVFSPYSKLTTYYPDNPRHYFDREDIRMAKWHLSVNDDSDASLVMSDNGQEGEVLRVEIRKAETQTSWQTQLNQTHLRVQALQRYRVSFRARADNTRNIDLGFARAHDPWTDLGLYRSLVLNPEWQSFQEEFIAEADDDNARILFDLGGKTISAEFADVRLERVADGQLIQPNVNARYFVEYKFNALGCRGRDYAIPRPQGTLRILLLGDSFTLGEGVHGEHTVAAQLERMLNEDRERFPPGHSYEVINCGVSGYGTREERLFYELVGTKYEPNIVLLLMVFNDDMSWVEEVQHGYAKRQKDKVESLFEFASKVQDYRYRRPAAEFSKCVEEIFRLDTEVRAHGARLGIVIFRHDSDYAGATPDGEQWNRLTQTVVNGLQNTDIPILDLSKALCETPCGQRLTVHPKDDHPNEIAHAGAAREILSFLKIASVSQGEDTGLLSFENARRQ